MLELSIMALTLALGQTTCVQPQTTENLFVGKSHQSQLLLSQIGMQPDFWWCLQRAYVPLEYDLHRVAAVEAQYAVNHD